MRWLRSIIKRLRPRTIIQTRASYQAFRKDERKRREVHEQLAREFGLPSPFATPKRAK